MSQGSEIKSKTESNVLESGPQIVEIGFPDDGLYTGPATKTATLAEDGSMMSDDENRTLTTLEAPPKPPMEVPDAGSSDAARKLLNQAQERKLPSVNRSVRKDEVMHQSSKKQMIVSKSPIRLPSKEDLIQKIRGRLTKSIEPKPEAITLAKPKTLDSSGAIEIPTDMILSSDIPATTIPSAEAEEIELEDHDLIAILEGNDVEIRCVAKASGCIEEDEDETIVEEMQITIMDGEEMHQAQLERNKEIARRQIESLPTLQKGRPRSRTKLEAAPELQQANTTTNNSPVVHSKPISAGVTIGQTTIRAIPKKTTVMPLDTPLATDSGQMREKQESKPKHIEKRIQPTNKPCEMKKPPKVAVPKAAVQGELSAAKLMKSPKQNPVVVAKKSQLIDSLVSDWDEEHVVMVPELKTEKDSVAKPSQSTIMSATQEDGEQGTQFVVPSSTMEPVKRVKKKKIIWDPSDSSMPFAALVKSGRNQQPTGESTFNEKINPSAATMRRKRADSVAVHMIDERSRCVDHVPLERKRALTPEPIKTTEEGFRKRTLKPEPSPVVIDPKAKKRKNEIERLLGDEGAINMLYDVECETTRKDLLKDGEVDTSDEDEKLLAKTKIITDVVIKQSKLPNENSTTSQALRVRVKRASTPSQSPGSAGGGGLEVKLPESPKAVAAEIKVANNNNNPTTARATATRKRKNASIGKDWDYVYNAQGGEDAMIIRRRSNSSYSSSASSRRLSIDLSTSEKDATPVAPSEQQDVSPVADTVKEKFLFAKPTKKASSPPEVKVDVKLLSSMKDVMSKALKIGAMKQDATKVKARSTSNRRAAPKGDAIVNGSDQTLQKHLEQLKELVCTKYDSFVELALKTQGVRVDINSAAEHETSEPLQDVFTFVVMNELRETLTLLENDESVHAVLLRSEGTNFSRGLDVGYLIQPPETLGETAQTMSECLKNFLKVLLSFSKPIVAAIHGEVIGMGVMLLPTFDLVIAQSGTMLTAPYGHLGYLPEALKAFSSCRTVRNKAITELLLLGKRITCYTALEYGLVTDVVIPERLNTRARSLTKTLATRSAQAIQSTKQHLRHELLANLDTILTLEQKQHAKQWTTAECQTMFKKFVEKGGVL
ncbi:uncharacterized protein LOC131215676 [Anopheles bellator]|uniref:uncharacterized protein LOC131215676 n=1 Tax=Anopheles bellator TaxID=139047 RepID=UPI002647EDD6|nr:uncharacterized protein LOC131215676 [Anopheles bellator]